MKKQMLKEIEVKLNNITLVIQTEEEILKGIVEEIRKKFERKKWKKIGIFHYA